jgi:glycosyltransferase involved in cell wall biosynthesis
MRILQILRDHEQGGEQKLARMIEEGLSLRNIAVETEYLYPYRGLSTFAKLAHVLGMARRIWRRDFDALIAYKSTTALLAGAVGWLSGCRLRIVHQTCVPNETRRFVRVLDKLFGTLGLYSANIVNSAATWAEFALYPARYRRSLILIEHGLDAPVALLSRDEARQRFGLPVNESVLLNVGRLCAQKNQDVLIRALACLPQTHLVLAGAGPKSDAFRALALTLGVDDRLHMLGALSPDDIAELYAAADLFVCPSTWETFGLAVVEAAMFGVPMVVADLPVLREVLRANGSSLAAFVPPCDTEGWILAIRASLAEPPITSHTAGFALAISRKYSQRRMIESYLSLLEANMKQPAAEMAQSRCGTRSLARSVEI